ncbi:P-loop containing nucleoside triphosphate hydrolase protein [Panaeolus papilionaceus]|nr:P-loop containing nucleoside triphosphate hydrolase protein [Panaeolus papilionaceus]
MTTLEDLDLKNLKMTGPVSVEECTERLAGAGPLIVILIMGPTGAGKSSFIEALAGKNHSLKKISSSRLEGCTQRVTAYHVAGITAPAPGSDNERPVYVVDTPGFADPRISEFDIVSSIRLWWEENNQRYFNQIVYFTPVTSVRLPGSQRAVLNTFKKLTGRGGAGMLTIVTSMWDTVWGDQASKRAERNFEQLRDEAWQDFITYDSQITRFYNTQESALQILDQAARPQSHITELERFSEPLKGHSYATNLREDLVSRIHALQMKRDILSSELHVSSMEGNRDLKSILESEHKEVTKLVAKFQTQLDDSGFGLPSTDPQDSEIPQREKKTGRRERTVQYIKSGIRWAFRRDR